MRILKRLCTIVGSISEWSGRVVMFLVLVLVASITYDVVMRYVFDAPTNWSYSFSYMLGTSIVAMGMPYVHHRGGNVRVDILYSRLPVKVRLTLDVVLSIVLFFTCVIALTVVFTLDAWQALVTHEVATDTAWYPILWPFKTVIAIGFILLLAQGSANFARDVLALRHGGEQPW
jgi:TRAP-type mannitol/chloroaromatic compound transport system permease small subunit